MIISLYGVLRAAGVSLDVKHILPGKQRSRILQAFLPAQMLYEVTCDLLVKVTAAHCLCNSSTVVSPGTPLKLNAKPTDDVTVSQLSGTAQCRVTSPCENERGVHKIARHICSTLLLSEWRTVRPCVNGEPGLRWRWLCVNVSAGACRLAPRAQLDLVRVEGEATEMRRQKSYCVVLF